MIIKKQICLLLAFFVLLSQTTAAFNVHFCNTRITAISMRSNTDNIDIEEKCCAATKKNAGCCHNNQIKSLKKSETVFLKSFYFPSEIVSLFDVFKPIWHSSEIASKKVNASKYFYSSNAPPLFTLNCQFVFYD